MRTMTVERLSPEELLSLDLARQLVMLNEIMAEIGDVGRIVRRWRDQSTVARIELMKTAKGGPAWKDATGTLLSCKNELDKARDRASDLRLWASILQTLLRAGSP